MALPERDATRGWIGRTVVDRDGAEIGVCSVLFADEATGLPEWMCADLDEGSVHVPLVDAVEVGGHVRVAVRRVDVVSAPSVGDKRRLSEAEEAALYRHYGIDYSRTASESLLPTSEAERPASDLPSGPVAVTSEEAPAAAASDDVVPSPPPESDLVVAQPDKTAPTLGDRRRLAVALGALTGLAALLTTVLRKRRLRARRPPTPAERAAQRARAASVAARARAEQIAASAAPLTATTRQVARRSTQAAARTARRAASATPGLAAAAASRAAAGVTAVAQRSVRGGQWVSGAVGSVPEAVSDRSERLHKGGRKAMNRLTMGLGFGAGYILGARAGRERFQQIKQAAVTVAQRPEVQQARDRLKTVAPAKLQSGTGGLSQRTAGVTAKLRRRPTSTDPVSGAETPPSPVPDAGMAVESPSDPGVAPQHFRTPPPAGDKPDNPLP